MDINTRVVSGVCLDVEVVIDRSKHDLGFFTYDQAKELESTLEAAIDEVKSFLEHCEWAEANKSSPQ